jgi:hypothetical protein
VTAKNIKDNVSNQTSGILDQLQKKEAIRSPFAQEKLNDFTAVRHAN